MEKYYQSLTIREKSLHPNHPDIAQSLQVLPCIEVFSFLKGIGYVYAAKGRYDQAELYYTRSLKILETQFTKNHPDVATHQNNLAWIYFKQVLTVNANKLTPFKGKV